MENSNRIEEFIDNTEAFCNKYDLLNASDIIVGFSGGPDSTALLIVLNELSTRNSFNLHAIHINHSLRGEESDSEEVMASRLCEKLGIPFRAIKLDVKEHAAKNKISLETSGRLLRYKQFDLYEEELIKNNPAAVVKIAVAHHANDLSETFLMNLFRGSGLEGLCSPRPLYKNIIRPFLFTTKEEIVEFLDNQGIAYAIDSTNNDLCCTRNGWRNSVLPAIKDVSVKDPVDAISSTYSLLYDDLEFITDFVKRLYQANSMLIEGNKYLKTDVLAGEFKSVSSRLIRMLWQDTFGNLIDFEQTHLNLVQKFINDKKSQKSLSTLDLSFGRKCFILDDIIGFCEESRLKLVVESIVSLRGFVFCENDMKEKFDMNTPEIPNLSISFRVQKIENVGTLEYNNLSWFLPIFEEKSDNYLILSNRIKTLKFSKAGSKSSKRLSDLLCDRYVPSVIRDDVVGIMDMDGNLLWVPGIGHKVGFVDECSRQRMMEGLEAEPLYYYKVSFKE